MNIKNVFDKKNLVNIGVIGLSFFVAFYIYKQQIQESKQIEQKTHEAVENNKVCESINQFEKKTSAYKELLARKDSNKVIDAFSKIAQETGIKITGIRPANEQQLSGYTKTPFDLVLSVPSFHALGKFIGRIESDKDVYMVDNLEIRSQKETKELDVNLTISQITATN